MRGKAVAHGPMQGGNVIRDTRYLCVSRRFLLYSLMIPVSASALPAHALPVPFQSGRVTTQQQQDQLQQRVQQEQNEQALNQRMNDLHELDLKMWSLEVETQRLKQLMRENFRRHYAIIRKDSEDLLQLITSLQADIDSNGDSALTRDMMAKTGKMQKLAREILDNMAGRKLPKVKPSSTALSASGTAAANPNYRQLLTEKTSAAKATATTLKSSVEGYLASDNEQTVSVGALQKTADKDRSNRFDPNSVVIINAAVQLEQLADEIRLEIRAVYPLP
jgi:hypothetical protein